MLVSTITARGRTSVPQPIKDALHTAAGTKLQWNLMPDGTITVRAVESHSKLTPLMH